MDADSNYFSGWLMADLLLVLAIIFLIMVPGSPAKEVLAIEDSTTAPEWIKTDIKPIELGSTDPYEDRVHAIGNPIPKYEITSGSLPSGIDIDKEDGVLKGTALQKGQYQFTISAINSIGQIHSNYQISINEAPPTPVPEKPPEKPLDDLSSRCEPTGTFSFDQIKIKPNPMPSWEDILEGYVQENLDKSQEMDPVTNPDDLQRAKNFLEKKFNEDAKIALVETFVGIPTPPYSAQIARDVNELLEEELAKQFPGILLHKDKGWEKWAADYFSTVIEKDEIRINLFFVNPLPKECP